MEYVMILLLAVGATVTPFWLGARYGVIGLVSPMHLLGYFCLFGFLIKVAVFGGVPDYAFYARYVDTPGALMVGAIYLACFVWMICLGYRFGVRPMRAEMGILAAREVSAKLCRQGVLFALAFALSGLTLALMLRARGVSGLSLDVVSQLNADKQINVNANGVGATLAGLKTLFVVPKLAFVLLLAQGLVSRSKWLLLQATFLAVVVVLIALVSGDRFELVELLIFGFATYVILGGRLRFVFAVVSVCAAVGVLALSAYMTMLRGHNASLLHQIVGSTYFLDINTAVMVTDQMTPQLRLFGESYGWWVFGWVPRSFWLDKPAIDLGVYFKRDVLGVMTGGAFNVTGPGEAYINFGWFGIGVGFVLGWLYRKGEEVLLCARNTLRYGSFLLYPMLFYPFVQATLQSSFSGFVVGAAAQLVLIFGMIWVFVPRYRLRTVAPMNSGGHAHA